MSPLAADVFEYPNRGRLFQLTVSVHHFEGAPYVEMHPGLEMVLLLTGAEERYCQEYRSELRPGNVALVASWEAHSWRMLAPETTALVAFFLPEFVGDVYFDKLHWLSLFAADPRHRPRGRGKETCERLLSIGQQIMREVPVPVGAPVRSTAVTQWDLTASPEKCPPAWETRVRLWLTEILLLLYQDWDLREDILNHYQIRGGYLAQILPALRLGTGEDGHALRVTLATAADACGLSVSRFRTLFRAVMGVSFGAFQLRRRLGHAARLLLTTDDSVESISEQCGFTDRSHLLRMFRQRYGNTPAEFRKEPTQSHGWTSSLAVETAEVGSLSPAALRPRRQPRKHGRRPRERPSHSPNQ